MNLCLRKYTILVVDDEENMLTLLKRVLNKEGYQIFCAESGEAGIKLAREKTVDLALIDVCMPGMDGIEVLSRLKEMNRSLPVIMITAFPTWEKEQAARKLGCTDYLSKPLDLKRLKELIKTRIKISTH